MFRVNLNEKGGFLLSLMVLIGASSFGQILTHEDSISAGLNVKGNRATAFSGNGELYFDQDFRNNLAIARLRRTVLFIGHRFSNKITFFSEMELDDTMVNGGNKGEIKTEQCFVKFDLVPGVYIYPAPYPLPFYQTKLN